jgi:hypothetical protein
MNGLARHIGTSHPVTAYSGLGAPLGPLVGVGNSTQLTEVFAHWGLPKPPPVCQPSRIGEDQQATRAAYALVERVGWFKASRQLRAKPETLRAAFDRWGLGQPTGGVWRQASVFRRDRQAAVEAMELAVRVGSNTAASGWGWASGRCTRRGTGGRWAGRPTGPRPPSAPTMPWWRPTGAGGPRPSIPGTN